jgi:hypothetical protein
MNICLIGENLCIPFSQSLERYFRYILKRDLWLMGNNISYAATDFDLIFVIDDPTQFNYCSHWIYEKKISPSKLRIMSYDNKNDINLLEFDTLKSQFQNSLKNEHGIDHKNIPFFRDQISLFFKGHGEQSLLQCLTYVSYNLGNYSSLLKSEDFSPEDLHQHFLMPGVQNWNEFVRRFNKYAPILYIWGWAAETDTITRLIKNISIDLMKIDASNSFVIFELEPMSLINEIVAIMEELAKQSDSND